MGAVLLRSGRHVQHRILHTSDLHGQHRRLLAWLGRAEYDAWVDTGDFQPEPRAIGATPEAVARHQRRWWQFKSLAARIREALNGRPALVVPGNHDRFDYRGHLANAGVIDAATVRDGSFMWCGLRVYATRAVGYGEGYWPGEAQAIDWPEGRHDMLVSHGVGPEFTPNLALAPIHDPLPGVESWRRVAGVEWHLHGHTHRPGVSRRYGCIVSNAATTAHIVRRVALVRLAQPHPA